MSIEVKVPNLPESVADATIATWHKKIGDKVTRDENMVDLETDKVVLEVPAPADGILQDILFPEGATVQSGELLARIGAAVAVASAVVAPVAMDDKSTSPVVRRMLAEHDLQPNQIIGSGKDARITKDDVVLDLVCYRRQGHNEADEPSVTQPQMYKKIKTMRPLREIYADKLISAGLTTQENVNASMEAYRDKLDKGEAIVATVQGEYDGRIATDWAPYIAAKWTDKTNTAVSEDVLQALSRQLLMLPEEFELHPVVKRLLAEREKMTEGEIPMNWGYAETMAYATLLHEGHEVRLSGQDCGRGTFAHRHAVLHNQVNNDTYVPLETTASDATKPFVVIDSVLSEEAVLAFEYGFAASEPTALVLWEAQFGDFANGAQVVIDQFISSGEQKWGRLCGLVMLLPHGYEGQGPEHSSARLERYMQLCAEQNIQVCTPTTPAQIFHLLRRQVVRNFRKPLIVMTPKSLLRHKLAVSTMQDLTQGSFHTVIPEVDSLDVGNVKSVVLCCGKVYYDLLEKRRDANLQDVAIVRIEQLYPFPKKALTSILMTYPQATRVVWCQEEPQNQGVWFSSQHNMADCLREDQSLSYAGRGFAAAPAGGSSYLHVEQQAGLVKQALGIK